MKALGRGDCVMSQNETAGPLLRVIKNVKMVTAEPQTSEGLSEQGSHATTQARSLPSWDGAWHTADAPTYPAPHSIRQHLGFLITS